MASTTNNFEAVAEQIPQDNDATLRKLLQGVPRLASVEARLSELSSSQKELLRRKLLGTGPSQKASHDRIPRATRGRPSRAIADEVPVGEVDKRLRELLANAENSKLAGLADRLETLTEQQKRSLFQRLLDLAQDGCKTARLSYSQQRCWFMEVLAPGTGTQNIAAAVRARGPLDTVLLNRCLNAVIARHEVLRTNIISSLSGPLQLIAPQRTITMPDRDLTHIPPEQRENQALEMLLAEAYKPFNLGSGSLIRITTFSLGPEDRILLLTLHHIVGDEWSIGVLLEELGFLYASELNVGGLPELVIQYADYAEWQAAVMTLRSLKAEVTYWREKLSGAPFCLEVPTDRPRPRVQNTKGLMEFLPLRNDICEGLASLSDSEQSTRFMTMLTAFNILLHVRTGYEDIIVGTDFANRNRLETSKLIGFFVNELAIRTDLSGDPSFRELLRRVRRTCLEAFTHQELPFQWLVEDLKPPRDASRTPVFQVVFDLHNIPMQLEFQGVSLQPMRLPLRPAKYDMTLFISQSPRDLHAFLEFNTDLYDVSTAERFLHEYQSVLGLAVADPEMRLSRFVSSLKPSKSGPGD